VLSEPFGGQRGYLLKGAWFLEQVTGADHHADLDRPGEPAAGFPVPLGDLDIAAADDKQHRRSDLTEPRSRQVRAATAGYHGGDLVRAYGSRGKRGGRACARPEQPERQP
jgi:hypothetical protein